MYNRTIRWRFHFNAMHNMTPENMEGRHAHSFLVIICVEFVYRDNNRQNACEKAVKEYLEQYNGKYLNELECFRSELPGIEKICEVIYKDTKSIAEAYGLHQVQVEVGDSPIAMFSLGEKLLLGGTYREVPDEVFMEHRERFEWQFS